LVTVQPGDLPIILSAPHGGRDAIPDVPPRQGVGIRLFNPRADSGSDGLTEKLADALEKQFGKRPYVVIARFHRKYLDANRPPELAYESDHPNAKAAYDTYHATLAEARSEVTRRWGRGILFDVHGQKAEPKGIFRGTQNGGSVTHLVERFGQEALLGDKSVFGHLARQGVKVLPAIGSGDRETNYTGGYITVTYGSMSGGTVDAIQLEFGKELRAPKADTVNQLTKAIAAFAEDYLPKTEQSADPVRVGVYRDVGAGRSMTALQRALGQFDGVAVQNLKADDIRAGKLADIDVLIHPGGSGSKQGKHLGEVGREEIRDFLREGGGFIGICAGAYLASADYDWSLDVLDAKVLDRKHWARGNGTVQIELSDTGKRLLRTDEEQLSIYYGQGPLLAPAGDPDIADYETVAIFKTEIAKNGAPKGVMKGTTAIAQGEFGRGRVVCFSPHPEKTEGLEALLHYAIEHVDQGRTE
jgi:N-formylglutamate amidohydrolase/glutamine amidotransferase-like uncharacterized protein